MLSSVSCDRLTPEDGEDRLGLVGPQLEHLRSAPDRVVHRHGVGLQVHGAEVAEPLAEVHHVGGPQLLVDADALHADVDQPAQGGRVADALRDGPLERDPEEVLLAVDPAEVAARVELPLVVPEDLVVLAGPGEGERLGAVERPAARVRDGEPGAAGADRLVEVDGHPADRVDELLERREVDLHVVVDRDAEVQLDRLDEALRGGRPVALERLVDAALRVRARDGHPQVARERQQPRGRVLRVEPQHHDRVGAGPGDVAAATGLRGIGIEAGVVVRADEQVVDRRPGGRSSASRRVSPPSWIRVMSPSLSLK